MLDEKEIEQIKLICETLRGPGIQSAPFDDAAATNSLAVEILRTVGTGWYCNNPSEMEGSLYMKLRGEVKKLVLEYLR